ncbi:MAG: aspartate carbamoyltransferase regulatory subunit [Candidatus Delongbacteria bacterium]|nr:aspartate carbamoyltransferase regulatory subunit [Candidatus Delongbacteria bacterium]MBN2834117.1 aspartate carbamoyltransferase regulatory subunit [Candidatus Delongbacteria bacterium]
MSDSRQYKVFKIEKGTVIDHIPSPKGLTVFKMLTKNPESLISIGLNFDSKQVGKKDLIKFEDKIISKKETDKISLIAPEATINIIEGGKVIEKRRIDIPSEITGFLKCINPSCITNIEKIETKFKIVQNKPVKAMCHYCEKIVEVKSDMIDKDL